MSYKVYNSDKFLSFSSVPTWVKLDRLLTFRPHLSGIAQKTIFMCHTTGAFAGSGWDAGAKTLLTVTLSLAY